MSSAENMDFRTELGIDTNTGGVDVQPPAQVAVRSNEVVIGNADEHGHDFWLRENSDRLKAGLDAVNQKLVVTDELRDPQGHDRLVRRKEWLEKMLAGKANGLDRFRANLQRNFANTGRMPALGEMARNARPMERLANLGRGLRDRVKGVFGRGAEVAGNVRDAAARQLEKVAPSMVESDPNRRFDTNQYKAGERELGLLVAEQNFLLDRQQEINDDIALVIETSTDQLSDENNAELTEFFARLDKVNDLLEQVEQHINILNDKLEEADGVGEALKTPISSKLAMDAVLTTRHEIAQEIEELLKEVQDARSERGYVPSRRLMDVLKQMYAETGRIGDVKELIVKFLKGKVMGDDMSAGVTLATLLNGAAWGTFGVVASSVTGGVWQALRSEDELFRMLKAESAAAALSSSEQTTSAESLQNLSFADRVFSQDTAARQAREMKISEAEFLKASERENIVMRSLINAISMSLNVMSGTNKLFMRGVEGVGRSRGSVQRRLEKARVMPAEGGEMDVQQLTAWVEATLGNADQMDQQELANNLIDARQLLMDLLRVRRDVAIKSHVTGGERFQWLNVHQYDAELFGNTEKMDALINTLADALQKVDITKTREQEGQVLDKKVLKAYASLQELLNNPNKVLDKNSKNSVHRMVGTQLLGTVIQGAGIEIGARIIQDLMGGDAPNMGGAEGAEATETPPVTEASDVDTTDVDAAVIPDFDGQVTPVDGTVTPNFDTASTNGTAPTAEAAASSTATKTVVDASSTATKTVVDAKVAATPKLDSPITITTGNTSDVIVQDVMGNNRLDLKAPGYAARLNFDMGVPNLGSLYTQELVNLGLDLRQPIGQFNSNEASLVLARIAEHSGWTLSHDEIVRTVDAMRSGDQGLINQMKGLMSPELTGFDRDVALNSLTQALNITKNNG